MGDFCSSAHFTASNSWCVVGQRDSLGLKEQEESLTGRS